MKSLRLRAGIWPLLLLSACTQSAGPRAVVNGGDAGGLARAAPAEEHFDAAALERVTGDPAAAALQALVVMRHEHIVFERYGHGTDAHSVLDLGQFARVLLALATGAAVSDDLFPLSARSEFDATKLRDAIASGARQAYPDYLSIKIWRRINAAPAWIDLNAAGAAAPADCCFHAQLTDWMRVAELLSENGRFEGKQLLPPEWMDRLRRPVSVDRTQGFGVELATAAHGAEPFETSDVYFLRGPAHWRMWVVPSLQLALIFGADDRSAATDSWDETRLPNLVMRTLSDRPASKEASKLQQLVPGH